MCLYLEPRGSNPLRRALSGRHLTAPTQQVVGPTGSLSLIYMRAEETLPGRVGSMATPQRT